MHELSQLVRVLGFNGHLYHRMRHARHGAQRPQMRRRSQRGRLEHQVTETARTKHITGGHLRQRLQSSPHEQKEVRNSRLLSKLRSVTFGGIVARTQHPNILALTKRAAENAAKGYKLALHSLAPRIDHGLLGLLVFTASSSTIAALVALGLTNAALRFGQAARISLRRENLAHKGHGGTVGIACLERSNELVSLRCTSPRLAHQLLCARSLSPHGIGQMRDSQTQHCIGQRQPASKQSSG